MNKKKIKMNKKINKIFIPADQVAEHPHSTFDYVNPADKVCFAVLVTVVLCILHPCHQTSGTRQLLRKSLQYKIFF